MKPEQIVDKTTAEEQERAQRKVHAKEIFTLLGAKEMREQYRGYGASVGMVNVSIEYVRGEYSSDAKGWRLVFDSPLFGYGRDKGKKWMGVGEKSSLKITAAQKEKAIALLKEVKERAELKQQHRDSENREQKRRDALLKADPELCKAIAGSDDYKIRVSEDGKITFQDETFTVEQWRKIAAMKHEHKLEMNALKESFSNK